MQNSVIVSIMLVTASNEFRSSYPSSDDYARWTVFLFVLVTTVLLFYAMRAIITGKSG